MENQTIPGFIAIDDDEVFNMITSYTIKDDFPNAKISTFLEPEKGLEFIQENIDAASSMQILLLDINMPTLSGWDVLEKLDLMGTEICSKLKIFILSSSVNERDKALANDNPLVSGYLEKPLKKAMLDTVIAAL